MTTAPIDLVAPDLREHVRILRRMRHEGIHVAARQAPLGEGPADFLDLVRVGPRRWLVALGDVKGRGEEAFALARDLRAYIASHAESTRDLGALLTSANAFVYERANGDQLVSVLLVLVDAERATVRLANAGHVSPLAVGRSGGVVALEGRGPALGLLPDVDYHDAGPLRLGASMVLLAVSDGVTDAVDREGHRFGRERVSRVLAASRENGPRAVVRNVLSAVAGFGSPDEADDRTALALRFV